VCKLKATPQDIYQEEMPVHPIAISYPTRSVRDFTTPTSDEKVPSYDDFKKSDFESHGAFLDALAKYPTIKVDKLNQAGILDVVGAGSTPHLDGEFSRLTGIPFQGVEGRDAWSSRLLGDLSTRSSTERFLDVFQKPKTALFIDPSLPTRYDPLSASVLWGLKEVLGSENVDLVSDVPYFYVDHQGPAGIHPFERTLPVSSKCVTSTEDVQEKTRKNAYDLVVFGSFLTDKTPSIVNQVMAAGYTTDKIALVVGEDAPLSNLLVADPHLGGVLGKFHTFVKEIDDFHKIHENLVNSLTVPSDVNELIPSFTKIAGLVKSTTIVGGHDKIVHAFIAGMLPHTRITVECLDVTALNELAEPKNIQIKNDVEESECVVINNQPRTRENLQHELKGAAGRNAKIVAMLGTNDLGDVVDSFLADNPTTWYKLDSTDRQGGLVVLSRFGRDLVEPLDDDWYGEVVAGIPHRDTAIVVSTNPGLGAFYKKRNEGTHVIQVGMWSPEESQRLLEDTRHLVSRGKFATINGSPLHALARVTSESKVNIVHVDCPDRNDAVFTTLAAERILAPQGIIVAPNKYKEILSDLLNRGEFLWNGVTTSCCRTVVFTRKDTP